MRSTTHKISSICLILAGYRSVHAHGGELSVFFFLFGAIVGACSPDWLEIAHWRTTGFFWWKRSFRESWIPHRTATHWLVFWIGLTAMNLFLFIADWLTPMGIPAILPWKRHSLGLVRDWKGEATFLVLCISVALAAFTHLSTH